MGPTLQTEDLLTVKESMRELGISRATLYRWIKNGKIKPVKIGQGHNTFFYRKEILSLKQTL